LRRLSFFAATNHDGNQQNQQNLANRRMSRHRHMLIVVSTIWYTAVPSTSSVCTTIVSRHCGGDMGHDAGNTRHDAGDTGHDATIRDTARRYGTPRGGHDCVVRYYVLLVVQKMISQLLHAWDMTRAIRVMTRHGTTIRDTARRYGTHRSPCGGYDCVVRYYVYSFEKK
jgi:hypothetical protein